MRISEIQRLTTPEREAAIPVAIGGVTRTLTVGQIADMVGNTVVQFGGIEEEMDENGSLAAGTPDGGGKVVYVADRDQFFFREINTTTPMYYAEWPRKALFYDSDDNIRSGRLFVHNSDAYYHNGSELVVIASVDSDELENEAFIRAEMDNALNERINALRGGVADLQDAMTETRREKLVPDIVDGKYISHTDGSIHDFSGYKLHVYRIKPQSQYVIRQNNSLTSDTASYDYAIYNAGSVEDADQSTFVVGGIQATPLHPVNGEVDINPSLWTAPLLLCVVNYTNLLTQEVYEVVEDVADTRDIACNGRTAYRYDGENLYTAWLDGSTEYVSWWRRSMSSCLFTFYRLGWRTSILPYPSTAGIEDLVGVHIINKTESDNIGPLSVGPEGETNYWTGGNHHYPDEVSPDRVTTARMEGCIVKADEKTLMPGDTGFAESVTVEVVNFIGDPLTGRVENGTLADRLSTETAVYSLKHNSIEVDVRQDFEKTVRVGCYYGMQSMMEGESRILTPNGAYTDWTEATNTMSFSFGDYPKFCRFIEKSGEGLQECWLWPEGAGDRRYLQDYNTEFSRGSDKSYHQVIRGATVNAGESIRWRGTYTWMRNSDYEDSELVCYRSSKNGKQVYVAVAKRHFSGVVPMPSDIVFDVDLDAQNVTLRAGEEAVLGGNIGDKLKGLASNSDLEQLRSSLPGTYVKRTEVSHSLNDASTTNVASAWSVNAAMNAMGTISTQLSDRISTLEGRHVALTEAEYEALAEKDDDIIYLIYEDDTV